MTIDKMLIVEDNVAEAIYAQAELAKAGFRNFTAVTSLSEGLEEMHKYNAVLSDLFFPAGNKPIEQYTQRFLPLYEQFKQKRFPKLGQESMVLRAVQACAEIFGVTPQVYVNDFMAKMNTPKSVLKAAQDSLAGIQDSEKYEKFMKIEEEIRNGTNLLLGIIISERANELKMPSVIVTSTHHHDDAFEAVRDLVKVPYYDTLVDGRKNWKGGIERLLQDVER